ncbi:MAG: hypothetical protein ISS66_17835 [Desulfobacteraceae bacterium]|nr:hypothetical protein [Desulfobacteraceae bacterium]
MKKWPRVSREHEYINVEQPHNPLSPYFCKYTSWLVNRMFAVAILEDLMRILLTCQILDTSNPPGDFGHFLIVTWHVKKEDIISR